MFGTTVCAGRVLSLVRVVVLVAVALVAGREQAAASSINVVPVLSVATVGGQVTVDVNVSGVTDLYAYQIELGFDPSLLQLVSYVGGAFLTSGGQASAFGGPFDFVFDNVLGAFGAADLLLGPVPGVSGSGTLLSMTFNAIAAGASSISLTNIILEDSVGGGISVSATGARVVTSQGTGTPAVPEPGTLVLLAVPLFVVMRKRWGMRLPRW